MSEFTRGPWIVKRNRVTVSILSDIDGTYITENVRAHTNQQANANLIAAAPGLHAELEADNALFRELLKNEQMDGLCAPIRDRLRSNESTLRKAVKP